MEQKQVLALIGSKKKVKDAPKKKMVPDVNNANSLRNDFTCVSSDGLLFHVFMRRNTVFPYIFSIGLVYLPSSGGSFILCRYNGSHPHKNKIVNRDSFSSFHVHMLFDQQLSDGTEKNMDAELTDRYITFDEALFAFLNDCNIQNWEKYFPTLRDSISQLRIEGV